MQMRYKSCWYCYVFAGLFYTFMFPRLLRKPSWTVLVILMLDLSGPDSEYYSGA